MSVIYLAVVPPADSVRVGAVARATSTRAVRIGQRPLENRLAAVEPPVSFEDWLEAREADALAGILDDDARARAVARDWIAARAAEV